MHSLHNHLQQPRHHHQQMEGREQHSERQQVHTPEQQHFVAEHHGLHLLQQQQQHLRPVQLPVLQPVENEQLSLQQQQQQQQQHQGDHQKAAQHQQALHQPTDLSTRPGDDTTWKQCAKCGLRLPGTLLQIHLVDCLTSTDVKPGGDLKLCSTALFVCSICAKISRDLESLREHERSHSAEDWAAHGSQVGEPGSGMFMCSPCRLSFPTSEDLLKHVEMHKSTSTNDIACRVCGKVFLQLTGLLQHMDSSHEQVKACPCGAIFPSKQEFRHHQELCMPVLRDPTAATNSIKSYKCRLCRKIFGTVQSRLQHERVHRRSPPDAAQSTYPKTFSKNFLVCSMCKQEFGSKENYRAHMRSHTGEKPYNCRHCTKSFTSLQGRWQHEKIHKR